MSFGHGLDMRDIVSHSRGCKEKTDNLLGYYALYNKTKSGKDRDPLASMQAMSNVFAYLFDLIKYLEEEAVSLEKDFDYLRKSALRDLRGTGPKNKHIRELIRKLELQLQNDVAKVLKLAITIKRSK